MKGDNVSEFEYIIYNIGMYRNLEVYSVTKEYSIKQTIMKMNRELIKAVVIVDENMKVLGLFSNGDMRNFFLKGGNLSGNIMEAMNTKPILYKSEQEVAEAKKQVERVIYPIVDDEGHLIGIIDDGKKNGNSKLSDELKDVPLVIMAGGKGTRLYPYTKILPKPLIPIGEQTITERIIDSFRKYGCEHVYMVLNHKAAMIKAYMAELDKDYSLEFVQEEEFLGTAGGLNLLKGKINNTFFLSNCDIVINDDLECVYKTHKAKGNKITFVCSMKNMVIPYGVVDTTEDGNIIKMREKPDFSFLINTGVYVLEPEVLNDIRDEEFIHMPDLAQRYIDKGEKVGVFPVSEQAWMDMGQISEMQQMMKQLGV